MKDSRGKLHDYPWKGRYATSQVRVGGRPVNILHDFYIPALKRSTRYDRIAGFFSSSSLAAASQGFSRFVENGGRARFIVGAQMQFEDVRTIVQLSKQQVERKLLEELEGDPNWPENVRDGVALLAWMVKHEHLDVRVGVRTHQDDGTILPLEYSGDGYMHEKWAIFGDDDTEILVSGSLNESATALSINAENLTLQPSWVEWNKEVIEDYHQSFEALWANTHPAIQVYKLPEAVQKRLIRFADKRGGYREIDGTPAKLPTRSQEPPEEPDPPESGTLPPDELLAFAIIRLAPLLPGGQYVGMETAPVTPWPHQRFVARRLIDTYPCNHLLCDEVGLGKTIEAGLVFRALWLSGQARSVRIFAPASLTSQWMHEMSEKFLVQFRRRTGRRGNAEIADPLSGETEFLQGDLFDYPLEIISTGLINNPGPSPLLHQMPQTDLVILDEAHKARRSAPDREDREASYNRLYWALRDSLYPKSNALFLATATPMQLNRVEAFDLLKTMPAAGNVQFSEDLCDIFYRIRAKLLDGAQPERHELRWLQRYLLDIERSAPAQWQFVMEHVLELHDRPPFEHFVRHGMEPFDWDPLQPALSMCAPLGRTMLRHNRKLLRQYQQAGLLKENLAFRKVFPVLVTLDGIEKEIYDELQTYCGELSQNIGANSTESHARAAVGFYLSFLRQRFASSFHSLRESLRRRLEKIDRTLSDLAEEQPWPGEDAAEELSEDEAIKLVLKNRTESDLTWESGAVQELLSRMDRLPATPRKTLKLLEEIQHRRVGNTERVRQIVVFTRYADTLNHLYDVLSSRLPGCPIGTFSGQGGSVRRANSGQVDSLDRTAVRKYFMQGEIDILLCTDAAAEGLNLQSADLLINFDLPWNPMLLEQRIGRIDRIGQHHSEIMVHNYLYQGSVEEVVYLRLVDRFRGAMEVAGELQFSLLPVQEVDFQDYAKSRHEPDKITEDQLIKRAMRHAERISERQQLMEFDAQKQREVYDSIERSASEGPSPVTLEGIWKVLSDSRFLQNLGCSIELIGEHQALAVKGIPGVENGSLLTASRELFERGLSRRDERALHFASYGDPVFDAVLKHALGSQPEVTKAWQQRMTLTSLEFGDGKFQNLKGVQGASENSSDAKIRLVPASFGANLTQSDAVGRVQRRVLLDGISKIAEQKLSSKPETPAAQLARIDSFDRDLSHRAQQSCVINIEPKHRAELAAYSRRLLWPTEELSGNWRITVDPLFVSVTRNVISRTINRLDRNRRSAEGISSRIKGD